ncbi:MAG: hypothetical protein IFNCLDLE_01596 [Ignavibacteriaceae bacterium]|nr:hypothetical protein [Ignavibacteriaceae bacterium]OQY72945.1 MAG: hypothetical protein B6D45_08525 [Ignavibacteriales bacterium UTCHB3]
MLLRQLLSVKGITLLLFLSVFSAQPFAQQMPTYADRAFIITDSSIQKHDELPVIEGSVDEESYILGAGDQFRISIDDIQPIVLESAISPDGFLLIPKVGTLQLTGTTLKDAKTQISREVSKRFKGREVLVTLSGIRKIKISIYGEVLKKGSKIIFANSRLNDILMDGGFTPSANIRNIRIISKNGEASTIDLLSFVRLADRSQNPVLQDGDYVMVDKLDKVVTLLGMVKYPGVYEYRENESLENLINIAGGFLDAAFTDTLEIIRFDSNGKSQLSVRNSKTALFSQNFTLQNSDRVIVRSKPEYLEEKIVTISGYVKFPGPYKIKEGETKLSEIIPEAGGFLENASLEDSYVIRNTGTSDYDPEYERIKLIPRKDMTDDEYDYLKSRSRQRKGRITIDFIKVFDKKTDDLLLKKNDQIIVPEKKQYITIIGQAVSPGNIEYHKGNSIMDYIERAGGFGWRAEEDDIRVIKSKTGEWIEANDEVELEPGDTIWIPEKPQAPKFWDVFKDSLLIFSQLATVIAATVAVIVSLR